MAGEVSVRCDRARQWASLRLDGELSELEGFMLERHVEECAACREWQAGVEGAATLLREAPLEESSRPFALPRGWAFPLRYRLALAGVAAAAALGSIVGGALNSPSRPAPSPPPELSFLRGGGEQARRPARTRAEPPAPATRRPPRPSGGAV